MKREAEIAKVGRRGCWGNVGEVVSGFKSWNLVYALQTTDNAFLSNCSLAVRISSGHFYFIFLFLLLHTHYLFFLFFLRRIHSITNTQIE